MKKHKHIDLWQHGVFIVRNKAGNITVSMQISPGKVDALLLESSAWIKLRNAIRDRHILSIRNEVRNEINTRGY